MLIEFDASQHPAMTAEQVRRKILPGVIELLSHWAKLSAVKLWHNGTVEILFDGGDIERLGPCYLRNGLLYTWRTREFKNPEPLMSRDVKNCEDDYTTCTFGCGCGCLRDLGYQVRETPMFPGWAQKHCKAETAS
jgi:hypothetical protein